MFEYIQLDLVGQATEVSKLEEASHVSVELHMQLVQQCLDLETLNKRVYAKLAKEIKAKKQYRERAEKAALMGKPLRKSRPKREIVSRRDGFYSVHLVDLDAATEEEALTEALEYVRGNTVSGRLHRIHDPGTGCWEAEIEMPLTIK